MRHDDDGSGGPRADPWWTDPLSISAVLYEKLLDATNKGFFRRQRLNLASLLGCQIEIAAAFFVANFLEARVFTFGLAVCLLPFVCLFVAILWSGWRTLPILGANLGALAVIVGVHATYAYTRAVFIPSLTQEMLDRITWWHSAMPYLACAVALVGWWLGRLLDRALK